MVNSLLCIQVIVVHDDAAFHAAATCAGPYSVEWLAEEDDEEEEDGEEEEEAVEDVLVV